MAEETKKEWGRKWAAFVVCSIMTLGYIVACAIKQELIAIAHIVVVFDSVAMVFMGSNAFGKKYIANIIEAQNKQTK